MRRCRSSSRHPPFQYAKSMPTIYWLVRVFSPFAPAPIVCRLVYSMWSAYSERLLNWNVWRQPAVMAFTLPRSWGVPGTPCWEFLQRSYRAKMRFLRVNVQPNSA